MSNNLDSNRNQDPKANNQSSSLPGHRNPPAPPVENELQDSKGKTLPIQDFGTIDFSKITIGEEYQITAEIQLFLIKNSLTSFMFKNIDVKDFDFTIIVERNNLSVIFNKK